MQSAILPNRFLAGQTRKPKESMDTTLFVATIVLVMIGLVMVYSSTFHLGYSYLKLEALRILVGISALYLGTRIRYIKLSGKTKNIILLIALIILLATLLLGRKVMGARRWIGILQPAEFAKLALIFWLASFFAEGRSIDTQFKRQVLPPLIVTLAIVILTVVQPAVGTSCILLATSLTMFFLGGVRMKYIVIIGGITLLGFMILVFVFPHSRKRINDFWQGNRYQQTRSVIAIGSGGLTGKGLGEGKEKFKFLPKMPTDFIFSAIGEEFGFIGSLIIFLLFLIILVRGLKIAAAAEDYFGYLLASGITAMIFIYTLIHIGVALGILPPTGQPLPFVSFGGSALVTNLFAIGLVLNISKFRIRRPCDVAYIRGWHGRPRLSGTRPW
jgi:cell division protein FtsW